MNAVPLPPSHRVAIRECGEPLVDLPRDLFAFFDPPPYMALGAPYGDASPWCARQGIVERLMHASAVLHRVQPTWNLLIFDAYRPNAVQAFMVEREFQLVCAADKIDPRHLDAAGHEAVMKKVFRVWGMPSDDPATPPPHSTGAAIDLSLADAQAREIFMGSPIDENSDRSNPDYFATAADEAGTTAHRHRLLLNDAMQAAGVTRHHAEWWHFSCGDQYATWRAHGDDPAGFAVYGRV